MGTVICVANQKGGVGKTTTSICLAQELLSRGNKVLFMDTDSQCNSTSYYEAKTEDEYTVMDMLCDDEPAANCVQHLDKGDIIPSDKLLSDAENVVKVDEKRFLHLKLSMMNIINDYDYVIIDTPPVIGVVLKNVLALSDYVVIPVEESGWALQGLMEFSDAINLAKLNNPTLQVAGILTIKTKSRTKKANRIKDLADDIAFKLNSRTFNTRIRESVKCQEALTEYYVTLQEYDPNGNTTLDYAEFTDELLEVIS